MAKGRLSVVNVTRARKEFTPQDILQILSIDVLTACENRSGSSKRERKGDRDYAVMVISAATSAIILLIELISYNDMIATLVNKGQCQ